MKIYDKIVLLKTEEIKPYFNNPRNNEKATQALVKIIPQVGFNVPIFVDKDYVIIKGHSRYHAAKILGLTELPCIISENTNAQNNTDRVYDNAVNELSQWNTERLSAELREMDFIIPDVNFNIDYVNTENQLGKMFGTEYNESDITKAIGEANSETNKDGKKYISVPCPKCGEPILVSPDDIATLAKQIEGEKK